MSVTALTEPAGTVSTRRLVSRRMGRSTSEGTGCEGDGAAAPSAPGPISVSGSGATAAPSLSSSDAAVAEGPPRGGGVDGQESPSQVIVSEATLACSSWDSQVVEEDDLSPAKRLKGKRKLKRRTKIESPFVMEAQDGANTRGMSFMLSEASPHNETIACIDGFVQLTLDSAVKQPADQVSKESLLQDHQSPCSPPDKRCASDGAAAVAGRLSSEGSFFARCLSPDLGHQDVSANGKGKPSELATSDTNRARLPALRSSCISADTGSESIEPRVLDDSLLAPPAAPAVGKAAADEGAQGKEQPALADGLGRVSEMFRRGEEYLKEHLQEARALETRLRELREENSLLRAHLSRSGGGGGKEGAGGAVGVGDIGLEVKAVQPYHLVSPRGRAANSGLHSSGSARGCGSREHHLEELRVMPPRLSHNNNRQQASPFAQIASMDRRRGSDEQRKSTFGVDESTLKEEARRDIFTRCAIVRRTNQGGFLFGSLADEQLGVAGSISRSPQFENLSIIVIVLHAIWLGVETDFGVPLLINADTWIIVIELAFFFYFLLEWVVNFVATGCKFSLLCQNGWFLFDSFMVLLLLFETVVVSAMAWLYGWTSEDLHGTTSAANLKILRLIRVVRVARVAKVLLAIPELMILLKGMAGAMRSMVVTMAMIFVIVYVFAIGFTQICADTKLADEYFRDVPSSMSMLLLSATAPDLVSVIEDDISGEGLIYGMVFYVFIALTSLVVLNMLLGVLVQVMSVIWAVEREKVQMMTLTQKLAELIGGKESVTRGEMLELVSDPKANVALKEAGIDTSGIHSFIRMLFDCYNGDVVVNQSSPDDDSTLSGSSMPFAEVLESVVQLRQQNHATFKDIYDMRILIVQEFVRVHEAVDQRLHELSAGLGVAASPAGPSPAGGGEGSAFAVKECF